MVSSVKRLCNLFIPIFVIFLLLNFGAPPRALSTESKTKKAEAATEAKTMPGSPAKPSEKAAPEASNKVDQVGETVGHRLDGLTNRASSQVGAWINAKVFYGITWLKLILCLFMLFVVLAIERVVRWTIDRRWRTMEGKDEAKPIRHLFLKAVAKPLSLFIWVYGIYIVLAPLAGRTLRVFIVIIGGILIIQNLTGIEIGPLLASLGIGGIAIALAAKDSIANFFGTLTILFDKPFQIGERVLIDK